jgi:hypothetical protein
MAHKEDFHKIQFILNMISSKGSLSHFVNHVDDDKKIALSRDEKIYETLPLWINHIEKKRLSILFNKIPTNKLITLMNPGSMDDLNKMYSIFNKVDQKTFDEIIGIIDGTDIKQFMGYL